jgi:NAD(P)-dependent dehydrogenase (short-subunit alcohol dehydrogenase family)
MRGKVCLVTGANAGLGKQVCLDLAARGAEVIMSARNRQQAEQVRDQIISETGNKQVKLLVADLSSFQETVHLSNTIKAEYQKLDVLINNAGIFLTTYQETADGIETQWMVNHLAPYLLTRRLLDLLQSAPEARIINVSSKAHLRGSIDFDNLYGRGRYNGMAAYSQSKLANILFTKELAQRLRGTHVSSFALHPGVVNTHIGNKNSSGWMSWAWKLGKPFMISPAKGAKTIVYLATEPQLAGLSGLYFVNCQPHPSSPASTDSVLSTKLWNFSEEQTRAHLTA